MQLEIDPVAAVDRLPADLPLLGAGGVDPHQLVGVERGGEGEHGERLRPLLRVEQDEPGGPVEGGRGGDELDVEGGQRPRAGLLERLAQLGEHLVAPQVGEPQVDEPDGVGGDQRQVGRVGRRLGDGGGLGAGPQQEQGGEQPGDGRRPDRPEGQGSHEAPRG